MGLSRLSADTDCLGKDVKRSEGYGGGGGWSSVKVTQEEVASEVAGIFDSIGGLIGLVSKTVGSGDMKLANEAGEASSGIIYSAADSTGDAKEFEASEGSAAGMGEGVEDVELGDRNGAIMLFKSSSFVSEGVEFC